MMFTPVEAPPPNRSAEGHGRGPGRSHKFDTVRQWCMAHPGQWARIDQRVTSGNTTTFKREGFEAVSRNNDRIDQKATVYLRWPPTDV